MINNILIRLYFFLSIIIYSCCLIYSHSTYLIWQDYVPFFNYEGVSLEGYFILFLYLALVSVLVPMNILRASDIFVWVLIFFLYIPILTISLGSNEFLTTYQIFTYIALTLSFIIISAPSFLMRRQVVISCMINSDSIKKLPYFFVMLWVFLLIVLLIKYSVIMSFSGLDNVYEQRALGKANSLLYGYAQVYFGYVVSIGLVALGLYFNKLFYIFLGVFGCLILYMITAERTIFILPVFVYAIHKLLLSKKRYAWLFAFVLGSGAYFLFIGYFGEYNRLSKDFGFYYLTRVVAIPGLFFSDYLNYFSEVGYTNFTHAKGFSLFFNASPALSQDPLYPELGRIIARDVHGINSNSNASFLATDGAAGLGLFGVLLVSIFLSAIFYITNIITKKWPLTLVAPVMAPMALTLTNGSIFTVLVSFGMFFWMMIFFYYSVKVRLLRYLC